MNATTTAFARSASDLGIVQLARTMGGPETWRALRAAAFDSDYIELDPIDVVAAPDIAEALTDRIVEAGPSAIVAHGTAARSAIEAVSLRNVAMPLLLAPELVARTLRTMLERRGR